MLRLILLLFLSRLSIAGYTLQDSYTPSNFFDMFTFFTDADPTSGYVQFVDQGTAQSNGLINTSASSVSFGVDSKAVNPANGRMSVRLTSKATYNQGLIVVDVAHMPGGTCGTWPAFWTVGPDWPSNGEIDIIEGVNTNSGNQMTLHTGPDCSIANSNSGAARFSGSVVTSNCDTHASDQATNAGCGISSTDDKTYGAGFNAAGGGVYATEWTSQSINIYHFDRASIPADITSGSPDPSSWGEPVATFTGGCDFSTAINNQSIVFDTTFCGQWAGQQSVWEADSTCSALAATCQDYVANNPAAFTDTYWEVNSLKVYTSNGAAASASPAASTALSISSSSAPVAPPSAVPTGAASSAPAAAPASSSSTPVQPVPIGSTHAPGHERASTFTTLSSSLTTPVADSPSTPALSFQSTSTVTATVEMTTTFIVDGHGFQQTNSPQRQSSSAIATGVAAQPVETQADGTVEKCIGSKDGCIGEEKKSEAEVQVESLKKASKRLIAGKGRWVVETREGDDLVS